MLDGLSSCVMYLLKRVKSLAAYRKEASLIRFLYLKGFVAQCYEVA